MNYKPMLFTALLLLSNSALAVVDNSGVLTSITDKFYTIASSWSGIMLGYASNLFWTLAVISLVFTGIKLILSKADIGDFFAEFIRFILSTGFFWWLLIHGSVFAKAIIDSCVKVGNAAMGNAALQAPSGVLDHGFALVFKTYDHMSFSTPIISTVAALLSIAILVLLALVAANMTVQFCSAWILCFGGVFLLGFGGGRWTQDIAINWYKTVLSVGVSLLSMTLLIGIASSILDQYFISMSGDIQLKEMTVVLVVCVILFYLVSSVPHLLSSIVGGSTMAGHGIGTFGMAAVMATTAVTSAAGGIAGGYVGISPLIDRIRSDQALKP